MNDITKKLLDIMGIAGYTKVCVRSRGIFGDEVEVYEIVRDSAGWPFVWEAVKQLGVDFGCGGTYYHQVQSGKLTRGTYKMGDSHNEWISVDR